MSKKIAPTLRHAIPRPLSPREVMTGVRRESVRTYNGADAYRELRALLAVARAAQGVCVRDADGDWEWIGGDQFDRLAQSIARLDRVSARPGRGRAK